MLRVQKKKLVTHTGSSSFHISYTLTRYKILVTRNCIVRFFYIRTNLRFHQKMSMSTWNFQHTVVLNSETSNLLLFWTIWPLSQGFSFSVFPKMISCYDSTESSYQWTTQHSGEKATTTKNHLVHVSVQIKKVKMILISQGTLE